MSSQDHPQLNRKCVFKTNSPPCTLRLNPLDPTVVYLGTYTLNKETNKRTGSVEVWSVANTENPVQVGEYLTASAILDMKIDPFNKSILSSVHSTGNLILWKIHNDDITKLTMIHSHQIYTEEDEEGETLITSINYHPTIENICCLSTTTGITSVVQFSKNGLEFNKTDFQHRHDLESWYCDFSSCRTPGLENVVFSGGDDRNLIAHDLRLLDNKLISDEDDDTLIWKTDRIHDAGIVSILNNGGITKNGNPYALWTGSYDDTLKNLDVRVLPPMQLLKGMPPKVIETVELGGGVWKLIPSPNEYDQRVLSCNMYDGGRILKYGGFGKDIEVVNGFKGDHESITYGGDWIGDQICSCSFYDNVVQIWDV